MKKQMKKLSLNRETLVNLEQGKGQVAGGLTAVNQCGTMTCMPPNSVCEWSKGRPTCFTCEDTCTTNLC